MLKDGKVLNSVDQRFMTEYRLQGAEVILFDDYFFFIVQGSSSN